MHSLINLISLDLYVAFITYVMLKSSLLWDHQATYFGSQYWRTICRLERRLTWILAKILSHTFCLCRFEIDFWARAESCSTSLLRHLASAFCGVFVHQEFFLFSGVDASDYARAFSQTRRFACLRLGCPPGLLCLPGSCWNPESNWSLSSDQPVSISSAYLTNRFFEPSCPSSPTQPAADSYHCRPWEPYQIDPVRYASSQPNRTFHVQSLPFSDQLYHCRICRYSGWGQWTSSLFLSVLGLLSPFEPTDFKLWRPWLWVSFVKFVCY